MALSRTLKPETVASEVEAWRYDEMDHSHVNGQFVDDLVAAGLPGLDVLDLGTGTAQISIALCQRLAQVRVMAIDLSAPMLDLARRNIEIAGLRERIQLVLGDVQQLPFADHMFDVVMSNSIVHHLATPDGPLREAYRVLRPGGRIFFRDLIRPQTAADFERLVSKHAQYETAAGWEMLRASLHAALTLPEIQALVKESVATEAAVTVTSDRHWTWTELCPALREF